MAERFDAVVLGAGPGGEVLAGRLLNAGKKVAIAERELLGGECAYWACVPSKTLIRPPEAKNEASRAPGTSTPTLDLEEILAYRDYIIRHLDDLLDSVTQSPTFSQAYLEALEKLELY